MLYQSTTRDALRAMVIYVTKCMIPAYSSPVSPHISSFYYRYSLIWILIQANSDGFIWHSINFYNGISYNSRLFRSTRRILCNRTARVFWRSFPSHHWRSHFHWRQARYICWHWLQDRSSATRDLSRHFTNTICLDPSNGMIKQTRFEVSTVEPLGANFRLAIGVEVLIYSLRPQQLIGLTWHVSGKVQRELWSLELLRFGGGLRWRMMLSEHIMAWQSKRHW